MSGPMTANKPTGGAPVRMDRPWQVWDLVIAAGLLVAMVPFGRLLEAPPVIDRISFENPTRYHISIEVSDGEGSGWMPVGTAERETTSTFEGVLDHGEVWLFRFSAQGEDGGELRVTREELERDQWLVPIPDRVAQELQDKGAPYPPY